MKYVLLTVLGLTAVCSFAQPVNDICDSAIVVMNLDEWCGLFGDFPLDATPSLPTNPSCVPDDVEKLGDVWFTFTTLGSAGYMGHLASDSIAGQPNQPRLYASGLFEGSCDQLEEISCRYSNARIAIHRFEGLEAGQQLFFRIANNIGESESLEICANSPLDIDHEPCTGLFVSVTKDTTLEIGRPITLSANNFTDLTPISYQWFFKVSLLCDDCTTVEVRPTSTTTYSVLVTGPDMCTTKRNVTISTFLRKEDLQVYIPNAFSPNGDGVNDRFKIFGGPALQLILELDIHDRWGNLLYRDQDLDPNLTSSGWDGSVDGEDVSPGTFLYLIKGQFIDGTVVEYSGSVQFITVG